MTANSTIMVPSLHTPSNTALPSTSSFVAEGTPTPSSDYDAEGVCLPLDVFMITILALVVLGLCLGCILAPAGGRCDSQSGDGPNGRDSSPDSLPSSTATTLVGEDENPDSDDGSGPDTPPSSSLPQPPASTPPFPSSPQSLRSPSSPSSTPARLLELPPTMTASEEASYESKKSTSHSALPNAPVVQPQLPRITTIHGGETGQTITTGSALNRTPTYGSHDGHDEEGYQLTVLTSQRGQRVPVTSPPCGIRRRSCQKTDRVDNKVGRAEVYQGRRHQAAEALIMPQTERRNLVLPYPGTTTPQTRNNRVMCATNDIFGGALSQSPERLRSVPETGDGRGATYRDESAHRELSSNESTLVDDGDTSEPSEESR